MLMVRVGGGFMSIDEFVYTHSPQEISRLKYKMAHEKTKLPKLMSQLVEKNKLKKFTWSFNDIKYDLFLFAIQLMI